MPEIGLNELSPYLKSLETSKAFSTVYLIHGDEYLSKSACDALLTLILPEKKSVNHEPFDGTDTDIRMLLDSLNTFSLFSSKKVVTLSDAKLFYAKQDRSAFLSKARAAWEAEDPKKAAKHLTSFLALASFTLEELSPDNRKKSLTADEVAETEGAWFDAFMEYLLLQEIVIPESQDDAALMEAHIKKGFPKKHYFIMTTDLVDKRRSLYKTFKDMGMVIDCSLPKGEGKTEQNLRKGIFREIASKRLGEVRKEIEDQALDKLCDITGSDVRMFAGNIGKLIDYCGDRPLITSRDIDAVLKRTKKDPVYELTGALSDRSLERSLFYLNSLLSDGEYVPLQVLSAIINHMRKLLIAKDFTGSAFGRGWRRGMAYPQFRDSILSSVMAYDESLEKSAPTFLSEPVLAGKEGGSRKSASAASDLLLAKNAKSPYPVYQTLLKSDNFTQEEMVAIFEILHDADARMKSSFLEDKLIIEHAIIHICLRKGVDRK